MHHPYNVDTYSQAFIKALKAHDLETIKTLPKADVHNHGGLGMRFEKFVAKFNAEIPYPPKRMDGIAGMDTYMQYTAKYVDSREGFEYLLLATIEEAIEDGVTLLEASVDWGWIFDYNEDIEAFTAFVVQSRQRFRHLIDFRPELGVFKGTSPEKAEKYVIPLIESGAFYSIDFYGEEKYYQRELTEKIFEHARENGLKTKFHAGEFGDARTVFDIIVAHNPDEIQHGINAYLNNDVMNLIKLRNIRLNICPSSNVVLGAVESLKQHPIRTLYNHGVCLSVNTDDLLFFHSSVSQEFIKLYTEGVFTAEELDHIRIMGLQESKLRHSKGMQAILSSDRIG